MEREHRHGKHGTKEIYETGTGQVLHSVHTMSAECVEFGCPIHCPSPDALAIGVTHWRDDRDMMERICEHGIGHPDPDSMRWAARHSHMNEGDLVHGCDGCCKDAIYPVEK